MTDADLLREVMNTVGQQGRLGEQIRCVVSVSMLTEGWDVRTVTHVLGVRAFGTQLLCEQVIGRALRRVSYDSFTTDPFDSAAQTERRRQTRYDAGVVATRGQCAWALWPVAIPDGGRGVRRGRSDQAAGWCCMNALQHAALDSVGQRYRIEVDKQADPARAEAEIGQKLRLVQRLGAFHRLEFKEHLTAHDNIGDVAAIEENVVI
jgi:superfamily II DNA or RNA helicase